MGASPEASPEASFTPAHEGWQPRRSCPGHHLCVVGARGKACPAQPLNPTDAEPTVLPTCHHSTAACDYSNRNADLGTYQA
jgi:hypothetical protein